MEKHKTNTTLDVLGIGCISAGVAMATTEPLYGVCFVVGGIVISGMKYYVR